MVNTVYSVFDVLTIDISSFSNSWQSSIKLSA